jgi:hypothetical protein
MPDTALQALQRLEFTPRLHQQKKIIRDCGTVGARPVILTRTALEHRLQTTESDQSHDCQDKNNPGPKYEFMDSFSFKLKL